MADAPLTVTSQPPFTSLDALREAHTALLERRRVEDPPSAAFLDAARAFVLRGAASGALLDDDGDRRVAQSLLDFWANLLYRADRTELDATLVEFDPALAPSIPDDRCPYMGLEAFDEASSTLFFGRQRLVAELITRLDEQRLVAVVGPSGSGKSSVVRAGLVPALKAGALPGSETWRYVGPIVPGSDPLEALAQAIPLAPPAAEDPPIVLVVDQFEEAYTLCDDDAQRNAFVGWIARLATSVGRRDYVALTMRSDFEPFVARSEELQPLFNAGRVHLTPLAAGELREAIEGPAQEIGLRFEPGVVDSLLHDILGEPAALPLLQFTLLELWKRRDHNRVTMAAYREIGGGRAALAYSADALYESLIEEEKITARRILLRMVRPGEGLEVTSSRVRRADLLRIGEDPGRIERVLEKFAQTRLLRVSGASDEDRQVEVAHEALVRNWPTLAQWLEEERDTLRHRRRLTVAATQWEALGRDPGALLRGAALEEAERYGDLTEREQAFIAASRAEVDREAREQERARERELELTRAKAEVERQRAAEQEHAARRMRRLSWLLAVMTLIAIAAAITAGFYARNAERDATQAKSDADLAAKQSRLAQASALAAHSLSAISEGRPQRALLLAVEAVNVAARADDAVSPAAEAALRSALSENLGTPLDLAGNRPVASALSADGRWVAALDDGGTAYRWDITSGRPDAQTWQRLAPNAQALALSPNGRLLATAGSAPVVTIWDIGAPTPRGRDLSLDTGLVVKLEFSPNGRWLAIVTADGVVRLAPLATSKSGAGIERARNETDAQGLIAFSDDSSRFAISSAGRIQLFKLTSTGLQEEPPLQTAGSSSTDETIVALSFSADARRLLAVGSQTGPALWDIVQQTPVRYDFPPEQGPYTTGTLDRSGAQVAVGSADGAVRLYDASSDKPRQLALLTSHNGAVTAINYIAGNQAVTSDSTGKVFIWQLDLINSESPRVLSGHDGGIVALRASPDGHRLVTIADVSTADQGMVSFRPPSADTSLRLWRLDTANDVPAATILQEDAAVWGLRFAADSRTLISGDSAGAVLRWTITGTTALSESIALRKHEDTIWALDLAATRPWAISGSQDGTARVWDLGSAAPSSAPIYVRLQPAAINAVALSPSGRLLAVGGADGTLNIWNLDQPQSREPIVFQRHFASVWMIAFLPGEQRLVSASSDGVIRLWSVDERTMGTIVTELRAPSQILNAALSPDGTAVAAGGTDGNVYLYHDIDRPAPESRLSVFPGHTQAIWAIAFSKDGTRLLTGGQDDTARLWRLDVADPAASMIVLRGHGGGIGAVAFSPDGRYAATGSQDATIRLWSLQTDSLVEAACQAAGRNLSLSEWSSYLGSAAYRKTCPDLRAHPSLIDQAKATAKQGNLEEATRLFQQALALDPDLTLDPAAEAQILAVDALVSAGRASAELGDVAHAIELFQKARQVDRGVDLSGGTAGGPALTPEQAAHAIAAPRLVGLAEAAAQAGDIQQAATLFRQATELSPTLDLNPYADGLQRDSAAEVQRLAAPALVTKAGVVARAGDVAQAEALLARALQLDPAVDLDPETSDRDQDPHLAARLPLVKRLQADALAALDHSNLEPTVATFRAILDLVPSFDLIDEKPGADSDPQAAAVYFAVRTLIEKAREQADSGDAPAALRSLEDAHALDPRADLDPRTPGVEQEPQQVVSRWRRIPDASLLAERATSLAEQGHVDEAIALFDQALESVAASDIPPHLWNNLCWHAAIWQRGPDVLDACEQAVTLSDGTDNGNYRDSRGVALAEAGRYQEAIADFEAYIDWAQTQGDEERIAQRREWIEALRADQNPFTPEVLDSIRDQ